MALEAGEAGAWPQHVVYGQSERRGEVEHRSQAKDNEDVCVWWRECVGVWRVRAGCGRGMGVCVSGVGMCACTVCRRGVRAGMRGM